MAVLDLLLAFAAAAAPPASSCQAALGPLHGGRAPASLPHQIDGSALEGMRGLATLREGREGTIVVNGGSLAGADIRGVRLADICFVGTDFSRSDWRGAEADGVGFVGASLEGADLSNARLAHVLFRNANLKNARAESAVLVGGRLDGGWFDGSVENLRLDGADLSGFRFDCGITIDDGCPVDYGGAPMSLRDANLTEANLWGTAELHGTRIDRTEVGPGDLYALRVGELVGPIIVRGGGVAAELTPDEYRSLIPFLLDPARIDEAPVERPRTPPAWVAPGTHALFVDGVRAFAPSLRAQPIFARLVPVLVGASSSRVAVRFNADGSVDAAGDAIGANAHMCSLSGERLRFDPATGWYSGPQEPSDDDPPGWRGRPMAVLMLAGDEALVHVGARVSGLEGEEDPRFSDYASCGARAGFAVMARVPVPDEEARRLFEELPEGLN